jgi:predicted anti-sigma-YlaC factor YlaD
MNCDKIRELLSPYLDEMTNEKETNLVKAHLDVCPECRHELEKIKAVCDFMRKLPVPEVPGDFYHSLESRLTNEKFKYFGKKVLRTPKRKGWIAAGAAVLALAFGIYSSTLIQVSGFVASIKDRFDQKEQRPMMAVDDILRHSGVSLNIADNSVQPGKTNTENNSKVLPLGHEFLVSSVKTAVKPGTAGTPLIAQVDSCNTAVVTSKIIVNNIGSSVQQVIHIAAANDGEYEVLPSNSLAPQTLSVREIKALSIKVDEEQSDKVLNQLNEVGITAPPVCNNIELTEQYNDAVKNINDLQQQIDNIKSQEEVSATDQARLNELQEQLVQWNNKKIELDAQIRKVTINVYLTEEEQL